MKVIDRFIVYFSDEEANKRKWKKHIDSICKNFFPILNGIISNASTVQFTLLEAEFERIDDYKKLKQIVVDIEVSIGEILEKLHSTNYAFSSKDVIRRLTETNRIHETLETGSIANALDKLYVNMTTTVNKMLLGVKEKKVKNIKKSFQEIRSEINLLNDIIAGIKESRFRKDA